MSTPVTHPGHGQMPVVPVDPLAGGAPVATPSDLRRTYAGGHAQPHLPGLGPGARGPTEGMQANAQLLRAPRGLPPGHSLPGASGSASIPLGIDARPAGQDPAGPATVVAGQHLGAGPLWDAPRHGAPVLPAPEAFDPTQLTHEDWNIVRNILVALQEGMHVRGGSELPGQRPDGFALSTFKAPSSGHEGVMETREGAARSVLLRCGETGRIFLLATTAAEEALDPASRSLLQNLSGAVGAAPGLIELSLVQSHLATLRQLGEDVWHISGGQTSLAGLLAVAGNAEMREPGWGGVRTFETDPVVQQALQDWLHPDPAAARGAMFHAVRAIMTLCSSPAHLSCAGEDREMIGRLARAWPREVPPAGQGSPCESLGRFASWLGKMGYGSLRACAASADMAELSQRVVDFDAVKRHYAKANLLSVQDMALLEQGLMELAYDPCQLSVEDWKAAMAIRGALDASLACGDAQTSLLGMRPDGFGLQACQAPSQSPVILETHNGEARSMLLKSAETGRVLLLVRRDAEEGLDDLSKAMLRHFQAAVCGAHAMVELSMLQDHLAQLRAFGKALPAIQPGLTLAAVLAEASQAEQQRPGLGALQYLMAHPARALYMRNVPLEQQSTVNGALAGAVLAFTTLGLPRPGDFVHLAREDQALIGRLAKVWPVDVPPAASGSACASLGRFACWLGRTGAGALQSLMEPGPNESEADAWQRMSRLDDLKTQWLNSGAARQADLILGDVGLARLHDFYATGQAQRNDWVSGS